MQPWQRTSKPEEPVYRRKSATHHMETGKDNADGTPGKFVEKGEFGATVQNWFDPRTSLYGLPTATGGMGNTDHHGDTTPDGYQHGMEKDWKAALAKAKTSEERAALYRDLIGKRTNTGS